MSVYFDNDIEVLLNCWLVHSQRAFFALREPGRMVAGEFTLRINTLRLIQAGPLRTTALRLAIDAVQRVGVSGKFRRHFTLLSAVNGASERLCVGAALLFRPSGLFQRRAFRVRAYLPEDVRKIAGV